MVKLLRRFSEVTSSAAQLLINMLIEEYPLDEMKPWSKKLHKALKVQVCNGRHTFSGQYKATDAVNINERSRQLGVKFNPSDARV
ncbi:hypothetical protein Tco_0568584 [Tanacetum coccineum]